MTRKDGIYVQTSMNSIDGKMHRVVTCIENGETKTIQDTIIEKQGPQPWLELDSSSTRTTTSGLKKK